MLARKVQSADKLAALNGFLLIISNEFAKEFCLPRTTLTLVGDLIRKIQELGDDDLNDLLVLFELGKVEVIEELERREGRPRPIDLKLVVSNPSED